MFFCEFVICCVIIMISSSEWAFGIYTAALHKLYCLVSLATCLLSLSVVYRRWETPRDGDKRSGSSSPRRHYIQLHMAEIATSQRLHDLALCRNWSGFRCRTAPKLLRPLRTVNHCVDNEVDSITTDVCPMSFGTTKAVENNLRL